jgi:hypothetical protein
MKRILFTEEDFDKLVGGEVVKKDEDDVEIALQDIGYHRMLDILLEKIDNFNDNQ